MRQSGTREEAPRQQGLDSWRERVDQVFVHFDIDAPNPDAFEGSIIRHELGAIRLYEISASAHRVHRRVEDFAYGETPRTMIAMHETGEGEVEQTGRIHRLQPGDLTVLHSMQAFSMRFPGHVRERVISIPAQMLSHELIASRHLAAISISCRSGIGRVARDLVASMTVNIEAISGREKERLGRVLIDILNVVAGKKLEESGKKLMDSGAFQTERIKLYINENLRRHDISARSIAAALGISQRYMNKLFEAEGTTVGRAILSRRLEGSKIDLTDPFKRGKSVTEIAYSWGFNSASHFSRAFRQRFGTRPRDVRGTM